jgi:hypothetical protein
MQVRRTNNNTTRATSKFRHHEFFRLEFGWGCRVAPARDKVLTRRHLRYLPHPYSVLIQEQTWNTSSFGHSLGTVLTYPEAQPASFSCSALSSILRPDHAAQILPTCTCTSTRSTCNPVPQKTDCQADRAVPASAHKSQMLSSRPSLDASASNWAIGRCRWSDSDRILWGGQL